MPRLYRPPLPFTARPSGNFLGTRRHNADNGAVSAIIATAAPMIGNGHPKATIGIKFITLRIVVIARGRPEFALKMLTQRKADRLPSDGNGIDLRSVEGNHGGLAKDGATNCVAVAKAITGRITDMPINQFGTFEHRLRIKTHIADQQAVRTGQ